MWKCLAVVFGRSAVHLSQSALVGEVIRDGRVDGRVDGRAIRDRWARRTANDG
jgi:hypothetical protein